MIHDNDIVSDEEFLEQSRAPHDIKFPIEFELEKIELDNLIDFKPTQIRHRKVVISHKIDFRKQQKGKLKFRKL